MLLHLHPPLVYETAPLGAPRATPSGRRNQGAHHCCSHSTTLHAFNHVLAATPAAPPLRPRTQKKPFLPAGRHHRGRPVRVAAPLALQSTRPPKTKPNPTFCLDLPPSQPRRPPPSRTPCPSHSPPRVRAPASPRCARAASSPRRSSAAGGARASCAASRPRVSDAACTPAPPAAVQQCMHPAPSTHARPHPS